MGELRPDYALSLRDDMAVWQLLRCHNENEEKKILRAKHEKTKTGYAQNAGEVSIC